MPHRRLPHVEQQFGRKRVHGGARKVMWYFRVAHGRRVRLKGDYGSPEFIVHYGELLASASLPRKEEKQERAATLIEALKRALDKRRPWQEVRYRVLKLHGKRCQCCGAGPEVGKRLHVDHIKPRSKFPELEWELSNLQILCEDCNLGKGAWDQTDWRPT
jgi:5-methylcytosine-specific restriction endonuclease McrA